MEVRLSSGLVVMLREGLEAALIVAIVLAYLKRLPVKTLKIDKSFIDDLAADTADAAIIETIIALSHILGLLVLAEGVETAQQANRLTALGCNLAQGYYFTRPLPAEELAPRLAAGNALAATGRRP